MGSFSKSILVSESDLDDLNHVNNIKYIEWIQEISREHWQKVAGNSNVKKYVWVVRNHNITYFKSALLGEELLITTEVNHWKGAISTRHVEIKSNKTGQALVISKTEWCLLDSATLRPKRVPEELIRQFELTQ